MERSDVRKPGMRNRAAHDSRQLRCRWGVAGGRARARGATLGRGRRGRGGRGGGRGRSPCPVESRRRVGVTVLPACEWNVYDPQVIRWRLAGADRPRQLRSLTVLRSAIEPVAAGLAARNATAEQCAELTECALGMVAHSRGHKLEGYLFHDVAFHRVILTASGNEMFARLGDVVAEVLAGRTHHDVMFEDPDPAAVTLHVQLAEAVRARDAARAEKLTREITEGALQELDILAP